MKVTKHVEKLLREGHKPKELLELGFSKLVITKVRRRLKEEKKARELGTPELEKTPVEQNLTSAELATDAMVQRRLSFVKNELEKLNEEIAALEGKLEGTPSLGLRHHFKCDCGASGFVAVHIHCTKCKKETWWGWQPKKDIPV
jgi:hypothetical protein